MTKLVIGLVKTRDEAEVAVERIVQCGYTRQDISLLMTDAARKRHFKADEARTTRGAFGAAVALSVVVPRLGLVVAGPIAAAIPGAIMSGARGGLRSILTGAGLSQQHAERYETAVKEGGILIGVYARDEGDVETLDLILDDVDAAPLRTTSTGRRAYDSFV